MTRQVWVENPPHTGMTFQETGELDSISVVLLHAHADRLQTPNEQIGGVRIQYPTQDSKRILHFLDKPVRAKQRTSD